jgi:hypothetical protein
MAMNAGKATGPSGDDRPGRREYYAKWWKENAQIRRVKRRERYATDKAFRDECQERVKANQERVRKVIAAGGSVKNEGRSLFVLIGGVRTECLTIGQLCTRVGRSQRSLNDWQRWELFPHTPIRTEGNVRLYTAEMIEVVRLAIESRPGSKKFVRKGDTEFYEQISKGWQKLGIDRRTKYIQVA